MNRFSLHAIVTILMIACSEITLGDVPSWASSNTQYMSGNILTIVCSGEGLSLSIARENSQTSCLITASRYLNDTLSIRSKSVETEKDLGFIQEILSEREIKNLQCVVKDEKINYLGDQVQVFQKCQFDFSKAASITKTGGASPVESPINNQADFTKPAFRKTLNTEPTTGKIVKSKESRSITIATVPQCDSITIEGQGITKCGSNPVFLTIPAESTKILVKAKDHQPREIALPKENHSETINVILDPL